MLVSEEQRIKRNAVSRKSKAKYYEENKEKEDKRCRENQAKRRQAVIEHYGGKCACCGESVPEFLAIDHIDGGGGQHRKKIGLSGVVGWLIKNKYPKGFRILCHNCNTAIGHHGYCPHKEKNK